MIKAQGGIFGWVGRSDPLIAALAAARNEGEADDHCCFRTSEAAPKPAVEPAPGWWVPGDWNGFFGLFTNVLLNVIVITGLCLGVVKLPDNIVFGRILPALGVALPIGNL